jgi:protein SCO1/2
MVPPIWGFVVRNKILLILLLLSGSFFEISQAQAKESHPSLFAIQGKWKDQNGKDFSFSSLKGKMTVLAMVYTSCDYTCPIITQKLKSIHRKLSKKSSDQTKFLLITFDPKRDTVAVLKKYSTSQKLDESSFILLTATETDTHALSMALDFKYKSMGEGHFSHSNQITVLDKDGSIILQQDIGKELDKIIEVVRKGTN